MVNAVRWYKEFEKLIQEDLQEVDDRMEEDEIDAAEVIEEYELLEQKTSLEKVEMLKKRRTELEAVRLAKRSKSSEVGLLTSLRVRIHPVMMTMMGILPLIGELSTCDLSFLVKVPLFLVGENVCVPS
ncbi:hypothetical protein LWI29_023906 [Acer saccharum]|uniref:Uncharacterized protein n=1 Tax=Acer saccharum TaxID=4024 RepID=A0AA39RJ72_ACESA|nr:hypothetical protein LWI29_023906 [Acer saccharum]